MKKTLLLCALAISVSAHKCGNATSASMSSPLDTKWALNTLGGKPIELPEGATMPWLQLADNKLTGFGGCNNLMGGFQLDGERLAFPNLGSTKMYCESTAGMEKSFMDALRGTNSFKLDGDKLSLMGDAGELATLKPAK